MSQEQADRALELLYGEASARDELTDDEAQVLLKWGEEQIAGLAAQSLDDDQFDEAVAQMLKLLSRINRFTARRADLSPEEQQEFMSRISASAAAVAAYTPSAQAAAAPDFDAYLQQQSALDNIANIQALTALIAPAAPAAVADTPPTPDAPAPAAAPPTTPPPAPADPLRRWWDALRQPKPSPPDDADAPANTGDDHDQTQP